METRFLTDAQWERIAPLLLGRCERRKQAFFSRRRLMDGTRGHLQEFQDFKYVLIDSTLIRAHQCSAGQAGDSPQTLD
jgi:hypothetical protein